MEMGAYRRVSPVQDVNAATPELVAEVDALHNKLRAAGVTHSIIVDEGAGYMVWGRGGRTDIVGMAHALARHAPPREDNT